MGKLADLPEDRLEAPIIGLVRQIIDLSIRQNVKEFRLVREEGGKGVLEGFIELMSIPKNLVAPLSARFKILADMDLSIRKEAQTGQIEREQGNGQRCLFTVKTELRKGGESFHFQQQNA